MEVGINLALQLQRLISPAGVATIRQKVQIGMHWLIEATLESCTGVVGSLGPSRNDDLTSNGGLHGAACRVIHKEDALVLPQGLQPAEGGRAQSLKTWSSVARGHITC